MVFTGSDVAVSETSASGQVGHRVRPVLVTIDVEAVPSRADSDHVRTLIYGDFGSGGRQGILEMMDAADEFGIRLSMFLDISEVELHGDVITEVGQVIVDRGHDLQLHLHPNLLPDDYWQSRGFSVPDGKRWGYPRQIVDLVLHDFIDRMSRIRGSVPEGYRAGSFQVSSDWLESATAAGMSISSNHNYRSFVNQGRDPLAEPEAGAFRWSVGPVELPVTQIRNGDEWRPFTIPVRAPADDPRLDRFLDRAAEVGDPGSPIVVLMHSWSLLAYSGQRRRFGGIAPNKMNLFRHFLGLFAEKFRPMSVAEYACTNLAALPVREYPRHCDAA